MQINLILLSTAPTPHFAWPLGEVYRSAPVPAELASLVGKLPIADAAAWLFWDPALGLPDGERIAQLSESSAQVLHAGLLLGLCGLPACIDFVSPAWMLHADPPAEGPTCTSWKLSLRACLIRSEALLHCGGPWPGFHSLDAAGLELGHRFIKAGVIVRHEPRMLADGRKQPTRQSLDLEDELLFLRMRTGSFWTKYAIMRMIFSGFASMGDMRKAWNKAARQPLAAAVRPFRHPLPVPGKAVGAVTVLIPTIDRYPYLRCVLEQLERQTVLPLEAVVIDQTPLSKRDTAVASHIQKFPVRMLYLDQPGQCSARNLGLNAASGGYVLFLDDDDEVEPDLIERHLANLAAFRADVSAGVADESGAGPLPEGFTFVRVSDVFPTNNCMIRKSVLERSGLFDLAYDRGSRADGDLGMRVYLSGALMILNPTISVFHHHAPMGGLRTHKARKITYAASRQSLLHRHLPSATEVYLWKRYFTDRQVREEAWLRAMGTYAVRGGMIRKIGKAIVATVLAPHTWWQIRRAQEAADAMLRKYPSIPSLPQSPAGQGPA